MKYKLKNIVLVYSVMILFVYCSKNKDYTKKIMTENEKSEYFNIIDSLSTFPQGTMEKDKYYELILNIYPEADEAWMSRSVAYNKRGDHAKGFFFLNKAVELNPESHLGYRGFVKLYMLHDYKGALTDFMRLDSLTDYTKPGAWGEDLDKVIGLCYLKSNKLELAKKHFRSAIDRITNTIGEKWIEPRIIHYLGISLYLNEEFELAIETFDHLLSLHINYAESYYYKAKCLLCLNKKEDANKILAISKEKYFSNGIDKNSYFETPFQVYPSQLNLTYLQKEILNDFSKK